MREYLIFAWILLGLLGCKEVEEQETLVDPAATTETRALYRNLKKIAPEKVLFGQQSATTRGRGWFMEPGRSDILEAAGDYPAVYGWDFALLHYKQKHQDYLLEEIKKAYARGGINTFSYHMPNPVSGKNCRDTTLDISSILPGGENVQDYKNVLDTLAKFAMQFKGENGNYIPIIFRPFHEHTGDWFWWCQAFADREEFIGLWQFTVEYLRNEKNIHHFLYAYSPDTVANKQQYLDYYPGDNYVDILGLDDYRDVEANRPDRFQKRMKFLVELGEEKGKPTALAEIGYGGPHNLKGIHDIHDWWTEYLLKSIKTPPNHKIAYLVMWANYRNESYFSIYPGHPSEENFLKMKEDSLLLFNRDMPNMYSLE